MGHLHARAVRGEDAADIGQGQVRAGLLIRAAPGHLPEGDAHAVCRRHVVRRDVLGDGADEKRARGSGASGLGEAEDPLPLRSERDGEGVGE